MIDLHVDSRNLCRGQTEGCCPEPALCPLHMVEVLSFVTSALSAFVFQLLHVTLDLGRPLSLLVLLALVKKGPVGLGSR